MGEGGKRDHSESGEREVVRTFDEGLKKTSFKGGFERRCFDGTGTKRAEKGKVEVEK